MMSCIITEVEVIRRATIVPGEVGEADHDQCASDVTFVTVSQHDDGGSERVVRLL